MRNLKRVLSLAMASVMLVGMMVVGAGAATTKDADKITHKEAAEVLASINVMVGDDNGNFNPEAILTREQAAKIITYMLMGKDSADNLTAAKAPFNDVKADRWSAGSIAYCVKQGILAGMGDGSFQPEANVTGSQFAKMVLTAVGYSAKYEGLTGNGYELNVAKLVRLAGLNDGLNIVLSNELTRDSAAQMALNGLKAYTVEYTGGGSVSVGDSNMTLNATRVINNVKGQEEYFYTVYQKSLKPSNSTDSFGRPSTTWKNGVTTIGTYSNSPKVSYTASTKESVVKTDIDAYIVKDDVVDVYVNNKAYEVKLTNKILADYTGAGRLVEIYTANDKVSSVVVVDTILGQISNVNTVANTVTISNKTNGKKDVNDILTVTVKKSADETMYNKLVELGKDAYVAMTISKGDKAADNKVATANAAESITGKYTSYSSSSGKRTINGTVYDDAYNAKLTMSVGNTYVVYLDNHGNSLYATAEVSTSDKNAYVIDSTRIGDPIDGYVYKAKLVFEDGTQEWVTVANINGSKADATNSKTLAQGVFTGYTVNAEGKYNLTVVKTGDASKWANAGATANKDNSYTYTFSKGTLNTNKVSFLTGALSKEIGGNVNNIMGSSKTVFLMASSDGSYKVYTGIKNVPAYTGTSGTILTAPGTNTASMVVLHNVGTSTAADYIFVTSKDYEASMDGDTQVYVYNTITNNGTIGTSSVLDNATAKQVITTNGVGLYKIVASDGNNIKQLTFMGKDSAVATEKCITTTNTTAANFAVKNGVVTINGKTAVTADDFACIAVNSDDGSATAVDTGDIDDFYRVDGVSTIDQAAVIFDASGAVTSVIFTFTLK